MSKMREFFLLQKSTFLQQKQFIQCIPKPEEPRERNVLLGKEQSTLLIRRESCITLVGVSSECAGMSSGSYMYSNLNYRTLGTVFVNVYT